MLHAIQLLASHGFSGYLIIATAIFCVAISMERLFFLYVSQSFDASGAIETIRGLVLRRKFSEALQICNQQSKSPELRVIKEGLIALENGREAIRSALGGSVLEVSKNCEKRVSFLSLVASAATLIGLFGTIMGLIKTFEAIAGSDPAEKARMLGLGISEAMHSTAAGVVVGVAAMVAHTLCVAKVDTIVGKSQKAALDLNKWIEQSERTREAS